MSFVSSLLKLGFVVVVSVAFGHDSSNCISLYQRENVCMQTKVIPIAKTRIEFSN